MGGNPVKQYLDEQGNPTQPQKTYLDDEGNPLRESVASRVSSGGQEISADPGFFQGVKDVTTQPIKDIYAHQQGNVKKYTEKYGALGNSLATMKTIWDLGKGIITASNDEWVETLKALGKMEFDEVLQHLPGIVPGIGPQVVKASEAIEGGETLRGLGQTAGIGATLALGAKTPAIMRSVKSGAVGALKKSAARNYEEVLLPSRKADIPMAETTARQMADKKIVAGSRGGLQKKVAAGKNEWGPKAGTAFQDANPIAFDKAYSAIEAVKDQHLYVKGTKTVLSGREGLKKFFDSAQEDLMSLADDSGNIPAQIVDNYVDDINAGLVGANENFRTNLAPKTVKKMEQRTARALRTILDTEHPTGAQINAAYSMYAKMDYFLENFRRAQKTAKSGLHSGSSKGFGALVERSLPKYVRNIPKNIAGIFDSVPWNTMSGASKQAIAESISNGNWGKVFGMIKRGTRNAVLAQQSNSRPSEQSQ